MKSFKSLIRFEKENQFLNDLKNDALFAEAETPEISIGDSHDLSILKKMIKEYDYTFLGGEECCRVTNIVNRRSVDSHFLNYIDLVYQKEGKLWGESIFSSAFKQILLGSIKNSNYKGSVIFLGYSSLLLPVIDVLSSFGFTDFVFLKLRENSFDTARFESGISGLIGAQTSVVNSTAFIQSQKEYTFCFVIEDVYEQQTLEDMSYFHFLSNKSIVFDLSGQSNFLFKEVIALGVNLTSYENIREIWLHCLRQRVQKLLSD
jgi:hypothetical protein